LWKYQFDTGKGKFIGASGAVIGDLNGDNIPEVIFTTYSVEQNVSHLILLDNKGTQLHKVVLAKRGSMSPPCLSDIDGDHKVEIIISLKDVLGSGSGGVQIWDVASSSDNLLLWPTGRGNNLRNGQSTQGSGLNRCIRYSSSKISYYHETVVCEVYNIRGQKTGCRKTVSSSTGFSKSSNMKVSSGVYFFIPSGKHQNVIKNSLLLHQ